MANWLEEQGFTGDGIGTGDLRNIPIVGPVVDDVTGAGASRETEAANRAREGAMGVVDKLEGQQPTWSQLAGPGYKNETAIALGDSQAAGAQADPMAIEAQRRALQQMQEVSRGGLTDADRAGIEQGNTAVATQLRGQREASLQDLRARGAAGGGAELAALFGGAQGGAAAMAQSTNDVNRQAQARALQAMQASGNMGSQMRSQSFGEQFNRGQAADLFTRSNVEDQRNVRGRNVDRRNQHIDNQRDAYQQQFGNRRDMAAMRTGQYNQQAQDAEQRRRDSEDRRANYATGTMKVAGGGA